MVEIIKCVFISRPVQICVVASVASYTNGTQWTPLFYSSVSWGSVMVSVLYLIEKKLFSTPCLGSVSVRRILHS